MKRILGLDLGTTSIGWALVNEAEKKGEESSITRLGVRVVPLTVDEQTKFEKGKSITTNAERTLKRSMRRNLQRFKQRRTNLIETLRQAGIIHDDTILTENGPRTTFATLRARARAATECVTLEELARILLMINKKRGYKSNRKAQSTEEEGSLIDGMEIAKLLHDEQLTPGQYTYQLLKDGKKYIPEFYRSDLKAEFDAIWIIQKEFHPDILTDDLYLQLQNKTKTLTAKIFFAKYGINTADNKGSDRRLQQYKWRTEALERELTLEELAFVIADINGAMSVSSGYLGEISDLSKMLYFNQQTIGQYILHEIEKNPHHSLKNKIFYRQDYLDEFEQIWQIQAKFHPQLTPELKKRIRDLIIFYQRPLKSKKALLDICTFEHRQVEITEEGKTRIKIVGPKVCPKSSPLFQEFRIWHNLNNVTLKTIDTGIELFTSSSERERPLELEEKQRLAHELQYKDKLTKREALSVLFGKAAKMYDMNYKELEGNRTNAALYRAFFKIIALSGHDDYDINKLTADEIGNIVSHLFSLLGFNADILHFDSSLKGHALDKQPSYLLWHLLYSYEGDNSKTGNDALIQKLQDLCHCDREYAQVLSNVTFQEDYGNLSAKAIRKLLPYMKQGIIYDQACIAVGYKHSERSRTKEELKNREYVDHIDLLPRNALRNPVVEKILNQMINVVNAVCEEYGKPDEIRIELARNLKQSAKEREIATNSINDANLLNEKYRKILETEFGKTHVSLNDLLRYKLYIELQDNGFKTLYSDTYIPKDKLFSKEFDIEHIIPQSRLFDDSFSNKTLETRSVNIEKSNATAFDYILNKWGENRAKEYKTKIDNLYAKGVISQTKHDKLLKQEADIKEGFIDRELRNSQYIALKAREILESLVPVVTPTVGMITKRLRQDWQLEEIMKELNWDKYDRLGLTITEMKDGHLIREIKDWTKRNDHRHHAMDALTIAFTKPAFIQYLNNLNARSHQDSVIHHIEDNYLTRDSHGKLRFCAPMPINLFRAEAKRQLEDILISIKAKNKVMTQNINKSKVKGGIHKKMQLTPRGQLHNETIYGHTLHRISEEVKVDGKMTFERATLIAKKIYREPIIARLAQYNNDPKKAFTGKNSPEKNPIWLNEQQAEQVPPRVKLVYFEDYYPIRKPISPDLKLEKVIDVGVRRILQQRLDHFKGDAKKAFVNLDDNPIYLNEEKGIKIKSVRIRGVLSAIPLHEAKNHFGHLITDDKGKRRPVDYVQTSSTHHIAIYSDAEGNLQDVAVSFLEATTRKTLGQPVVDTDYNASLGWKFLFSMKQNEYFVFSDNEHGFDPKSIDLFDQQNKAEISKHLYRVQKLSRVDYGKQIVREYVFRHHLETTVNEDKELKNVTFKNIKSLAYIQGIVKVRINHLGDILPAKEF